MHHKNLSWRSGTLNHDLPETGLVPHVYPDDFSELMGRLSGGITFEEATFLAEQAQTVTSGCIVEVGSFKGRSAVALSIGARAGGHDVQVFCIEPHTSFVGVYGGIFGPGDRAQFYRAMLATDSYVNTALINLSSEDVIGDWKTPVSLCFIDGDHTYAAVRRDFDCWADKMVVDGLLILDDTRDPVAGPALLKTEVEQMVGWAPVKAPGKFAAFRKLKVLSA